MFEDIVNTKFEGIDIGTRDITSEIKAQLTKGLEFGMENVDDADGFSEVINQYMDENLDTLAQMYIDEFSAEEIIEMLNFEMTPLAQKKLRFQIRMQQFITEGFTKLLFNDQDSMFKDLADEIFGEEEETGFLHALKRLDMDDREYESAVWDSKDETEA